MKAQLEALDNQQAGEKPYQSQLRGAYGSNIEPAIAPLGLRLEDGYRYCLELLAAREVFVRATMETNSFTMWASGDRSASNGGDGDDIARLKKPPTAGRSIPAPH